MGPANSVFLLLSLSILQTGSMETPAHSPHILLPKYTHQLPSIRSPCKGGSCVSKFLFARGEHGAQHTRPSPLAACNLPPPRLVMSVSGNSITLIRLPFLALSTVFRGGFSHPTPPNERAHDVGTNWLGTGRCGFVLCASDDLRSTFHQIYHRR